MQLCSTKIQKTALYCLLFHNFSPYSQPFCGLDWLCWTQCANTGIKPNGSRAQKHYPALWWAPGPAHPAHISHGRAAISSLAFLLSVRALMRAEPDGPDAQMPFPITSHSHTRHSWCYVRNPMWSQISRVWGTDQTPFSVTLNLLHFVISSSSDALININVRPFATDESV